MAVTSLVPSIILGMLVQRPPGARPDAGRRPGLSGNAYRPATWRIRVRLTSSRRLKQTGTEIANSRTHAQSPPIQR